MEVNIIRTRYAIVLDDEKIYCGLARDHHFKPLDDVKNGNVKTYLSEIKARNSFIYSWQGAGKLIDDGRIKFVKITELIKE